MSDHLIPSERRDAIVAAARDSGLLDGARGQIGARIPGRLLAAAKARTGLRTTTEVVEYALATVATEDDFATRLLALKGTVPADLDLEF